MATGDEPQLGGRSDDDAPMISSVQTRVIVSARGAYTAGNLKALVQLMSEEQQHKYKRVIIQRIWNFIRADVEASQAESTLPVLFALIPVLDRWLQNPSANDEELLRAEWRGVLTAETDRPTESALCWLLIAVLKDVDDLEDWTANAVAFTYASGSLPEFKALSSYVRQWQVEAAWVMLQGKTISPLELPA